MDEKIKECCLAIAYEAHIMGRVYNKMGEPEKPSEVCNQLRKMVTKMLNSHLTIRSSRAAYSCEKSGHVYHWRDGICIHCGALKPPPA